MHSDDKLNDTYNSNKRDKLSDETQRLMPVSDLSEFPSISVTAAYPAVTSETRQKIHLIKTITWDKSELEDQIEFAKKLLSDLLKENDRGQIEITKSVVVEIKNIIAPFQTNIELYRKARDQAEISGLDIDKEEFIKLTTLLRTNLFKIQECLNKINMSLRDRYNESLKAEKESGETSRSETSYLTSSNRLVLPEVQLDEKQKQLDNIKKSIDDARGKLERAESDQERTTWLETLSILAGAQARKKEELERTQRMPQVSA